MTCYDRNRDPQKSGDGRDVCTPGPATATVRCSVEAGSPAIELRLGENQISRSLTFARHPPSGSGSMTFNAETSRPPSYRFKLFS